MENSQKCGLLTEGGDLYYYDLETEQLEKIDNNVDGNLGFAITYSDEIVYLKLKAEYTGDLYAWNKNHKKMICENVTTANKISCYLNEVALIDRKTNGSTLLLFCDKNNWNKQGFDLDSFIKHSDFLSCSYDFIKQRLAVFQSISQTDTSQELPRAEQVCALDSIAGRGHRKQPATAGCCIWVVMPNA